MRMAVWEVWKMLTSEAFVDSPRGGPRRNCGTPSSRTLVAAEAPSGRKSVCKELGRESPDVQSMHQ